MVWIKRLQEDIYVLMTLEKLEDLLTSLSDVLCLILRRLLLQIVLLVIGATHFLVVSHITHFPNTLNKVVVVD
jgi:hypothetical protein